MEKEELKLKIDINNVVEKEFIGIFDTRKEDYIIDDKGNAIYPVSPLECKLIEEIKLLKERVKKLEEVRT